MEPMFRKLGMPVLLQKGVIMLLGEFKLCKAGKPITPEQSRLLVSMTYNEYEFPETGYD
jgi:mRNA turnover protein 4